MIDSLSNNLIKHASSLKDKKYRNMYGEFLAEGARLIEDIINFDNESIAYIFSLKDTGHKKCKLVSEKIMRKLSDTMSSQNIVAVVKKKRVLSLDELVSKNKNILFLDRILDPNNLGTIVRTAVAANYAVVLLNCTDIYSNKVVRGSMGAVIKADFYECDDVAAFIQALKQKNYTILSASMGGKNVFDTKKSAPVCIVIGCEAHGVDERIILLSDEIITIPMMDTESLNASVAAGILAYQFSSVR